MSVKHVRCDSLEGCSRTSILGDGAVQCENCGSTYCEYHEDCVYGDDRDSCEYCKIEPIDDNAFLPDEILDRFVRILNRAVESDRDAISYLVNSRVKCNRKLAEDPTIQIGPTPSLKASVGLLGIINGLCGICPDTGYGAIQAVLDYSGNVLRFDKVEA